MEQVKNEQLKNIKGGGISWGLVAGLSAIASFLAGIIDGIINPQKCNN